MTRYDTSPDCAFVEGFVAGKTEGTHEATAHFDREHLRLLQESAAHQARANWWRLLALVLFALLAVDRLIWWMG